MGKLLTEVSKYVGAICKNKIMEIGKNHMFFPLGMGPSTGPSYIG